MIALRTVTIAVVLSGALLTAAFAAEVVGHNVRPERRNATGDRIRQLQVPPGFTIDVLAQNLGNPRMMVVDDQDFLRAFLIPGGAAHFGRVAGLTVAKDGALLVSAYSAPPR